MEHYKQFVWKVFAFAGIVMVVIAIMWNIVTFTRPRLCHRPDKTTLILGTSRIQYGFDDSFMPTMWNVGLNADNYNLMYWKLKLLHKYNAQIDNVILEVDQITLFGYFEGIESKLHPYYWDVMDFDDWISLAENDRTILMNPFDWVKTAIPVKSIFSTQEFQNLGLGGYSILERDKIAEALTADRENQSPVDCIVNDLQIEYLDKIVAYCQQNSIRIEFISMPSYPTKRVELGHRKANQYIEKHYPNIKYHDYELIELADSCYGDIAHLNYKGAAALAEIMKADFANK